MAKTIIQTIGPLYGEAINGTVFGRPNGSIYVPPVNTIQVSSATPYVTIQAGSPDKITICNSLGSPRACSVIAESQDIASNIQTYLEDENGDKVGVERNLSAGLFNQNPTFIGTGESLTLVNGDTYYVVAVLVNSGEPVATAKMAVTAVVI